MLMQFCPSLRRVTRSSMEATRRGAKRERASEKRMSEKRMSAPVKHPSCVGIGNGKQTQHDVTTRTVTVTGDPCHRAGKKSTHYG